MKFKKIITIATIIVAILFACTCASAQNYTKENIVVMTDSYGDPNFCENTALEWCLKDCYNLNVTQYHAYAGRGFQSNKGDYYSWLTYLNEYKADKSVTNVILVGGYNDFYTADGRCEPYYNNIYNNACKYIEAMHAKFPNATIQFCFFGRKPTQDTNRNQSQEDAVRGLWYSATNNYKYAYYVWNCDSTLSDGEFCGDMIHPTNRGVYHIASQLAFMIKTNNNFVFNI